MITSAFGIASWCINESAMGKFFTGEEIVNYKSASVLRISFYACACIKMIKCGFLKHTTGKFILFASSVAIVNNVMLSFFESRDEECKKSFDGLIGLLEIGYFFIGLGLSFALVFVSFKMNFILGSLLFAISLFELLLFASHLFGISKYFEYNNLPVFMNLSFWLSVVLFFVTLLDNDKVLQSKLYQNIVSLVKDMAVSSYQKYQSLVDKGLLEAS